MLGHLKNGIEKVAEGVNEVIDISCISGDIKNQLWEFLENNSTMIRNSIESHLNTLLVNIVEDYMIEKALEHLYELLPFPLRMLIPKIVFIEFGKIYFSKIKEILSHENN